MSWFSRIANAIHSKTLDDELRAEMTGHMELRADSLREEGLSDEQARHEAARRFGNVTQLREQSREIKLSTFLESTFSDLRYAVRGMRKSPAFALTAIISLALATGVNTAIYSIIDAALLRPLPLPQPERLITLANPDVLAPGEEPSGGRVTFSYPLYQQFRTAAANAADLALISNGTQIEVRIPDKNAAVERAICQFVSGDAFETLGVPPTLGRVFSAADDRVPWGQPDIVISYDYWQRRFNGDPRVLGQHIYLGVNSFVAAGGARIVGVAQKGFFGVEPGKFVDIWMPAMMYSKAAFTQINWGWLRIFGRLKPGVTPNQLKARLDPVQRSYDELMVKWFPTAPPAIQEQFHKLPILVLPGARGASSFQQDFARPLWIVFGVAAGILLIACANVASLLLARSTARASELAMRISLGASRLRLIRQMLAESLILSIVAGVLGWCFAQFTAPLLIVMLSERARPVRFSLAMDSRVLLFSAAVSALAGIIFGLLPALQASGAQPITELRGGRNEAGKLRLGRVFVGVQVAFAFVLIVCGASFLFTLKNLLSVEPGFNPHHVATISVSVNLSDMTQRSELNQWMDELQRRIESLPGIEGAALAMRGSMFEGSHFAFQVIVPGKPLPEREEYTMSVSPRYFSAMRIPLITGRDFEQRDRDFDRQGPRPAIVNQAFARRYFGSENPIGKIFQSPYDGKLVEHEIIGVVGDAVYASIRDGKQPIWYTTERGNSFETLYIRSRLDLGSVVKMVEREAEAIGHGTRIREITTLDTLIGDTLLREKLLAGIGGAFAFIGLLLAAIGLFGLLNYSVTRRTKEIGIRAALGARRSALIVLVLRDVFALIGGGIAAGLACALGAMTFVRALLFGIRSADPFVITIAAGIFLAAALIAGGLPAFRAAAIDPMTALRDD